MKTCQICGENPDNYKGNNEFVCSRCTDARVNFVAMLEKEFAREIRDFKNRTRKGKKTKEEPLGIVCNKEEYEFTYQLWKSKWEKKANQIKYDGKDLKEARKSKGISTDALALYLGISKSYLCIMEKGQKPLSVKAIAFIKSGINLREKTTKSLNKYNGLGK